MDDPMTTETAEMFLRRAEALQAELARVRAERDSLKATVDAFASRVADQRDRAEAAEAERDRLKDESRIGWLESSLVREQELRRAAEAAEAERDEWKENAWHASVAATEVAEEKVAETERWLREWGFPSLAAKYWAEFGSVAGDANEADYGEIISHHPEGPDQFVPLAGDANEKERP